MDQSMPKKGGGADEALSSREQELRLLVETIPALVSRAGAEGNVEFTAQLQAILNVLPAYTWYSAPSGSLTFVNKRTAEYLGVPDDHPLRFGIDIGAQWDDWVPLLHPDDQEEARKYWSNLLRTGEGGEHSYRVRSAQGDYRWFLTRIEPLRASDGTLLLWIGATLDIEELKCAEEALRESEYKLRQIFETVPSHLWSANSAFEPTSLNQHLLDYFGRGFKDFQHGGWEAFLHPDDLPETAKAISHAVQTGTYFQVVHRLRRADGEFRWHHARGEPLRDRQGNIIQWYGLSVDIDEAKKSEDRLRRSGAYLAEAQRLSHTGSFGWTPSTGELHWSNETFRILEYDPSMKPTVEHVLQRVHPDERATIRRLIEETSSGEKDLDLDHRLLMPNGSVKFVHVLSHAMKDAAGNLEIVGVLMDVTENTFLYRDLAEREARLVEQTKALRSSEGYLAEAQRLSHTGTWVLNPTTMQYLYWSDESYQIWAFDPLQGFPSRDALWQRIHPDDRERVWEKVQEALRQKRDYSGEFRIVLPDGTVKYLAATSRHLFSTNGELVEVIGTNVDVTERKRVEEALRESEARARSALDGIAGLIVVLAPNGEVETANRPLFEYFGRSLEELKNWGTSDAVHPEDLPHFTELFKKAIASGNPYHIDQRLRRLDGEYRWFDARGVPIRDDSGRIARWYVLATDIEDRTRALAQLEQMQLDLAHMNRVSMMGELAASLSHEITQPIASARNNARAAQNFLDMQPPDLSEIREALNCVVSDTDRAGDIVDRIRDHIKKTPPRKEHFDLNEAINEVIVLGRSAVIKNGISVQTRLSEGLSPIHCDRVQLQQVVLNLILNAAEAMGSVEGASRDLLISTKQHHAGVLVAVRDSGPGIDPTNLERVFEAFYTTKPSGTGMGLSICRSIIDAHGGRLWAEANEPCGTIFQFTLPAVQVGS
jgi:hypothetical protein